MSPEDTPTPQGLPPATALDPEGPYLLFRRATSPADLENVFRLRYQVYVIERGFERPEDHPGGLERDRYDDVAIHILCVHREGFPVGTIRLIPPSPLGYPLEQHCQVTADISTLPRERLAEVSRLAVTQRFQRRREDPFNPAPAVAMPARSGAQPERRRNDLVLGLYREVYRVTKERGFTHWYAAMEDRLWHLLATIGFKFDQIGPYVEYHGRRAPFVVNLEETERTVRQQAPELYRFFVQGLA